jgi:hypothetical protein
VSGLTQSDSPLQGLCAAITTPQGARLLGSFQVDQDGRIHFEALYDGAQYGLVHPGEFLTQVPPALVHGLTMGNEPVSLLGAFCESATIGPGGMGKVRLLVNQLLIGATLTDPKAPIVEAVMVAPPALDRFLQYNGFRGSVGSDSGTMEGVGAHYLPMTPVSIDVKDGESLRYSVLLSDAYGTRTVIGLRSVVETTKSIGIRFPAPVSMEEAEHEIGGLCRLIGLMSGLEMGFSSTRFLGKAFPDRCSLHFTPSASMRRDDGPVLTWLELQQTFGATLATWTVKEPELRLAIDYFVGSRPDRPGYMEDRLFAAFAAIDALHRVVAPTCPSEKGQWRLVPLLSCFPTELVDGFRDWVMQAKDRMVGLRNDLAHGDRRLSPPLGKEEALGILWRLRLVVWRLLLSRLGVPTELILKASPGLPGRL